MLKCHRNMRNMRSWPKNSPFLPYLESVTVCDMCHVLVTPEEGHRSTGVRHQAMRGNALVDGSCE